MKKHNFFKLYSSFFPILIKGKLEKNSSKTLVFSSWKGRALLKICYKMVESIPLPYFFKVLEPELEPKPT